VSVLSCVPLSWIPFFYSLSFPFLLLFLFYFNIPPPCSKYSFLYFFSNSPSCCSYHEIAHLYPSLPNRGPMTPRYVSFLGRLLIGLCHRITHFPISVGSSWVMSPGYAGYDVSDFILSLFTPFWVWENGPEELYKWNSGGLLYPNNLVVCFRFTPLLAISPPNLILHIVHILIHGLLSSSNILLSHHCPLIKLVQCPFCLVKIQLHPNITVTVITKSLYKICKVCMFTIAVIHYLLAGIIYSSQL